MYSTKKWSVFKSLSRKVQTLHFKFESMWPVPCLSVPLNKAPQKCVLYVMCSPQKSSVLFNLCTRLRPEKQTCALEDKRRLPQKASVDQISHRFITLCPTTPRADSTGSEEKYAACICVESVGYAHMSLCTIGRIRARVSCAPRTVPKCQAMLECSPGMPADPVCRHQGVSMNAVSRAAPRHSRSQH